MLTQADQVDEVDQGDVSLIEAMLGYNILIGDEVVGAIEGLPGQLDYLTVELHWEGKGVARAALNEFIHMSRIQGASEVVTNNAVHDAMEHILKTEGFTKQAEDSEHDWVKEI